MSDDIDAALGSAATLDLDTVDATAEHVTTRLLDSDGEPFGVELALDLGPLTTEVVLDPDATAALAERLDAHCERLDDGA
jgi:hypothetical protein